MRLEKFFQNDKELYEQLVFNEETMGMNLGRTFTEEEAAFFFRAILEQNLEGNDFGFYKAFVGEPDKEEYIGMGAITQNDEYEAPEIEYMLLPQFWNKGYGTELVEILLSMVKEALRIVAITDPDNTYSRRILLNKGFESVKQYRNDDGEPAELFQLKRPITLQVDLMSEIRRVKKGDENALAYIQTESWKAAFAGILDAETLNRCTNIDKATAMYKRLLDENKGNGYILFVDDNPHCIAYWDAARDPKFEGKAELICIHSLPDNWHKGYGSKMMDRVLKDIKEEGYSEVVLWVFRDNFRARSFYESKGFELTGISKPAFDTVEVLYSRSL